MVDSRQPYECSSPSLMRVVKRSNENWVVRPCSCGVGGQAWTLVEPVWAKLAGMAVRALSGYVERGERFGLRRLAGQVVRL